jgi:hypothetical protein
MEALDRRLVTPVKRLMQEPSSDIVVCGSFDCFFVNGQIRESLDLMALELGDNLAQFCGTQAGANNRAIQMWSKLPEFSTLPGRHLAWHWGGEVRRRREEWYGRYCIDNPRPVEWNRYM